MPKGAYRTPDGGYISETRLVVERGGKRHVIVARAVKRKDPDLKRLGLALIEVAGQEIEAEQAKLDGSRRD